MCLNQTTDCNKTFLFQTDGSTEKIKSKLAVVEHIGVIYSNFQVLFLLKYFSNL